MLQLDFDPQTVCRICLSDEDKLGNLFLSTVVDGYILSVPEMVSNCLDMKVIPSDGLPDKLCGFCKSELINFYRFKQKSKRTDTVLRTMIPKSDQFIEESPEPTQSQPEATEPEIEQSSIEQSDRDQPEVLPSTETEVISEDSSHKVESPVEILPEPSAQKCHFCEMEFALKTDLLQHIIDDHTKTHSADMQIKLESEDSSSDLLKILDEASECDDDQRHDYESFEVLFDDDQDVESNQDTTAGEQLSIDGEAENAEDMHQVAGSEMMDYEELEEASVASPTIFSCGKCNEIFELATELEDHIQMAHPSMKCNNCDAVFSRKVAFDRHCLSCKPNKLDDEEEWIPDEEPAEESDEVDGDSDVTIVECTTISDLFECDECKSMFTSESKLKTHVRNHHAKSKRTASSTFMPQQCPVDSCESEPLKTQLLYDQHIKMHEHINVFNNYMTFYPCHTCRQIFECSKFLQEHMAEEHKTFPKQETDLSSMGDESCFDYQFLDEDGYEEGTYKCGNCAETFNSSNETKHHIVSVHLDKFKCPEAACGCQYDQFARFALHVVKKHIKGGSHSCSHCDQKLDSYDAMQAHLKNDCKERKYACTHCEKKFFSKKALCHHMSHIKGKRFTCQYCGKTFTQQGELTIHLRTHTGERPFVCTVCGKAYKTSSMRTAHMDTHIPGKTFSCPICSKMMQTRTSYRNHLKRHTQEKQHVCQYCNKQFFTKYHVNLHISKIHEKVGAPSDTSVMMFDIIHQDDEDEEALAFS